jgi:signal transduction histidine kinase
MKFCRRQFRDIALFLLCETCIYVLYFQQDPGQVYKFYSFSIAWNKGIGYLQIDPSVPSLILLVIVNIIGAIIGFYALFRYTHGNYEANMEDVVMKRKFDAVRIGVSMFVHSMKNQLLSTKVIYKRIDQLYEQPEIDTDKLREYIETLRNVNDGMLVRIEELYRSVKSNTIEMSPLPLEEVLEAAVDRFHEKYPEGNIEIDNEGVGTILVDKTHFCEVLYNLLINAEEAVMAAEREGGQVSLHCKNERLYSVIEVRDNGRGMTKSQIKKIFDPFYSSKNSNSNWGMGLYYAREIVKSHLGNIRVESEVGKGSSFYVLLPKYE